MGLPEAAQVREPTRSVKISHRIFSFSMYILLFLSSRRTADRSCVNRRISCASKLFTVSSSLERFTFPILICSFRFVRPKRIVVLLLYFSNSSSRLIFMLSNCKSMSAFLLLSFFRASAAVFDDSKFSCKSESNLSRFCFRSARVRFNRSTSLLTDPVCCFTNFAVLSSVSNCCVRLAIFLFKTMSSSNE
eukprot:XP_001704273.1 Hypothetical protein GL50803_32020 [Giardia lamblia ATCC 50803]